jgi:cation:H+ antiporter
MTESPGLAGAVLLLLAGFFLLTKGADLLVDGASHLAYALGVTPLFVGLTIVSFGTSAPELAINLLAARGGSSDIALGNVVGSNLANMALIAGVSAVLRPVQVQSLIIVREIPFLFLTGLALWFLADDRRFQAGGSAPLLSRGDGLVLLLFFAIFLYYLAAGARGGQREVEPLGEEVEDVQELERPPGARRAVGMVVLGLVGLILGGHWVVRGATTVAHALGWSEALIAVTIIAVGTSLPELVTSAVAARRGAADVALGNVVGSSIFNTVAILGITAVIHPLPVNPRLLVDVMLMLVAAVALFLVTLHHRIIHRWEGALLALGYAGYLIFVVARG